MKVGDIYWIELPAANGHEQAGRRPAIIMSNPDETERLPVVFVIPLTTAQAALRFTGTLLIEPTASNGLSQPSVALVFQLRAVDRRRILDRIGLVGDKRLKDIFATLDWLMGRSTCPQDQDKT